MKTALEALSSCAKVRLILGHVVYFLKVMSMIKINYELCIYGFTNNFKYTWQSNIILSRKMRITHFHIGFCSDSDCSPPSLKNPTVIMHNGKIRTKWLPMAKQIVTFKSPSHYFLTAKLTATFIVHRQFSSYHILVSKNVLYF